MLKRAVMLGIISLELCQTSFSRRFLMPNFSFFNIPVLYGLNLEMAKICVKLLGELDI
jgi:hypothetical protein